jgi:hypothetical protein
LGRRPKPPLIAPGIFHSTTSVSVPLERGSPNASRACLESVVVGSVRIRNVQMDHRRKRSAARRSLSKRDHGVGNPDLDVVKGTIRSSFLKGNLPAQALLKKTSQSSGVLCDDVGCQSRSAGGLHSRANRRRLKGTVSYGRCPVGAIRHYLVVRHVALRFCSGTPGRRLRYGQSEVIRRRSESGWVPSCPSRRSARAGLQNPSTYW